LNLKPVNGQASSIARFKLAGHWSTGDMQRKPAADSNRERITVRRRFSGYLKSAPLLFSLLFVVGLMSACAPAPSGILTKEPVPVQPAGDASVMKKDPVQQAYRDFTMASIALSRGNYGKARKYLESAIGEDPQSAYLNRKMGLLLKELREYPEALVYALKSIEIEPEDVTGITLVGDLYALTGKDDPAIEQYQKVLDIDPDNQRIRLLLTTILVRKKQFQRALNHLDALIEQDPELVVAHYYLGRINLEMNRYKEAEKAFDEALKLNSSLEPALFDLATVYQMTNREKEAAQAYERLLKLYPDNIPARERLIPSFSTIRGRMGARNEE
jgi:tetratricopeptide (TPR) repeat protein